MLCMLAYPASPISLLTHIYNATYLKSKQASDFKKYIKITRGFRNVKKAKRQVVSTQCFDRFHFFGDQHSLIPSSYISP